MSDNQAQKNTNPSQPSSSQDQKKPDTAPKDVKSYTGTDKSAGKGSASGSSSGSR